MLSASLPLHPPPPVSLLSLSHLLGASHPFSSPFLPLPSPPFLFLYCSPHLSSHFFILPPSPHSPTPQLGESGRAARGSEPIVPDWGSQPGVQGSPPSTSVFTSSGLGQGGEEEEPAGKGRGRVCGGCHNQLPLKAMTLAPPLVAPASQRNVQSQEQCPCYANADSWQALWALCPPPPTLVAPKCPLEKF